MTSFMRTCDLTTMVATMANILISTKAILYFTDSTKIGVHPRAGPLLGHW